MLQYYPFRHEDRSHFYTISELKSELEFAQIKGKIKSMRIMGEGKKKRLIVTLYDNTGIAELVWFRFIYMDYQISSDKGRIYYIRETNIL